MQRKTEEVNITVELGEGGPIRTGDQVFNHILEALFFYMNKEVKIQAEGDLPHHLWEDTGLVVGKELAQKLGGDTIARYGTSVLPMDDALVLVSVDISRPYLNFDLQLTQKEEGFQLPLIEEFLRALVRSLGATIHIKKLEGTNPHHLIEACFKALGTSLGKAFEQAGDLQSTKGNLR